MILRQGERIGTHAMISSYPSVILLVESLEEHGAGQDGLRAISFHALDEVLALEAPNVPTIDCRCITGLLLGKSRKKNYMVFARFLLGFVRRVHDCRKFSFLGHFFLIKLEPHKEIRMPRHRSCHSSPGLYKKALILGAVLCPISVYSWPYPCSFSAHSLWRYFRTASQLPRRCAFPRTSFVPAMTSQQLSLASHKYFFLVRHSLVYQTTTLYSNGRSSNT